MRAVLLTPIYLVGAGALGTWINRHVTHPVRKTRTKEPKK
jgi:hypothetical protein